jgi:ATP-dependent Lhr-like helicase
VRGPGPAAPPARPRPPAPLWQQRQRSAQLLSVASEYASFPIVLETMRECLQDVFDVPGLVELMRDVESRGCAWSRSRPASRPPSRAALLFGYVASFMYEGDAPLAERRAQALALDTALLAELLGQRRAARAARRRRRRAHRAELQRLTDDRRARDAEGVADLLRLLGPADHRRGGRPRRDAGVARQLEEAAPGHPSADRRGRALGRGRGRRPAARRAGRAVAGGVPEPSSSRARTRWATCSHARAPAGLSAAMSQRASASACGSAALAPGRARARVEGEFRPGGPAEWCDAEVLRRLRGARCALRKEVEPAPPTRWRFLPAWQGSARQRRASRAFAARRAAAGAPVPARARTLVLPARVAVTPPRSSTS